MRCSNCGKCCETTEMLLSKEDIERLERVGFSREDFTVTRGDGLTRLRNVGQWCYFYNPAEKKCQVYEYRPLGCFIYPVVYSIDEGVIVDELCPVRHAVSEHELKMKGKILLKHLKKLTSEAKTNVFKSCDSSRRGKLEVVECPKGRSKKRHPKKNLRI